MNEYNIFSVIKDLSNASQDYEFMLKTCLNMSSIFSYAQFSENKQMISFLINNHLREIADHEEPYEFIETIFEIFNPTEILNIITLAYHRYRELYHSLLSKLPCGLTYCKINRSKWKSFTELYSGRILRRMGTNNTEFLYILMVFKRHKKVDYIMNLIKNNKDKCRDLNFILADNHYCSLSEIGMNKTKLIKLINDYYRHMPGEGHPNNIVYFKCLLNGAGSGGLPKYKSYIDTRGIKNRYLMFRETKVKYPDTNYIKFINNIKIHLLEKCNNINLELFYHQHRRDKLNVSKVLALPARLSYNLLSLILPIFISRNLARLSGYYV